MDSTQQGRRVVVGGTHVVTQPPAEQSAAKTLPIGTRERFRYLWGQACQLRSLMDPAVITTVTAERVKEQAERVDQLWRDWFAELVR